MSFTGNEDHSINLNDAAALTARYREEEGDEFLGGYFSKAAINKILEQDGCVGIRIYNGLSASDKRNFVLVGVNANGDDLTGGELAEFSIDCPSNCPANSVLAGTD